MLSVSDWRDSGSHPSLCKVESGVREKDAVVSAWFVGAQQGEAASN